MSLDGIATRLLMREPHLVYQLVASAEVAGDAAFKALMRLCRYAIKSLKFTTRFKHGDSLRKTCHLEFDLHIFLQPTTVKVTRAMITYERPSVETTGEVDISSSIICR